MPTAPPKESIRVKSPPDELEAAIPRRPILDAVRECCLDCSAFKPSEIRKCVFTDCALWPFRMGTNPYSNHKGNTANLRPGAAHANDNRVPALTEDAA